MGMVLDLELLDGTTRGGVLSAVNAEILILENWGGAESSPNGDPLVVRIELVRRILIP